MINTQKGPTFGDQFLGSFVWKATKPMMEKLQSEHPQALIQMQIWE
jgi:hypothetical protein